MDKAEEVRNSFFEQAYWCSRLGSPFSATLLRGLGQNLDTDTRTGSKILNWQGDPGVRGDVVALRLAGALHGLVLEGKLPELAKLYPPAASCATASDANADGVNALISGALCAIRAMDQEVLDRLAHAPQTNEIARSILLYAGMGVIARQTKLPLCLFELGASGGLNLIPDLFCYRIAGKVFGDEGSKVSLEPEWGAKAPGISVPEIVLRRGCDLNPLNVRDPGDASRLLGFIWPDQSERLERTRAAIELAQEQQILLEKADAGEWLEQRLAEPAPAGQCRVVFHSIAYQYFPQQTQKRIKTLMEAAGKQATRSTPLAWLSFEQHGDKGAHLSLRMWPDAKDRRILARANAHCQSVEWLE